MNKDVVKKIFESIYQKKPKDFESIISEIKPESLGEKVFKKY
jgi:hypothetical protein